jgi:hypothetical protein
MADADTASIINQFCEPHGAIFNAARVRSGKFNSPAVGTIDLNADLANEVSRVVTDSWQTFKLKLPKLLTPDLEAHLRRILDTFIPPSGSQYQENIERICGLCLRLCKNRLEEYGSEIRALAEEPDWAEFSTDAIEAAYLARLGEKGVIEEQKVSMGDNHKP